MKIIDAINKGASTLLKNNIPNPNIDSEYLLSEVLGMSRMDLFINKDLELTINQLKCFEHFISIRKTRKPLQYILNSANFYGLDFYVDENVLIPRSETEYLCEYAINIVANNKLKVLDLCTGSGVICVTVAKHCPFAEVYASDISDKALEVASKNSKSNNVKVNFILSDLFKSFNELKFDLIISNPPYINSNACKTLQLEVMHEPSLALDGGYDGLDLLREIVTKAPNYLKPEGLLLMEIGEDQGAAMQLLLNDKFKDIKIIKDLQNRDRYVYSKLKEQI